ncbi:unnamed protein product [Notodromas monacha]|uniref:Pseudouridylate synthase RPUSD4, mitochondrial n=1 Tax=Notodromas monacha TaxID=399045 RepID=A0A7R9BQN0_9CRUS|nr:unnamed protein product [Notodromas monacha]CAG0919905.1 unnamed protein product [Notodromas monacha]
MARSFGHVMARWCIIRGLRHSAVAANPRKASSILTEDSLGKRDEDKSGTTVSTPFGSIRFDASQKSTSTDLNPIDDEYFGSYFRRAATEEHIKDDKETPHQRNSVETRESGGGSSQQDLAMNHVDQQYFGNYLNPNAGGMEKDFVGLNIFGGDSSIITFARPSITEEEEEKPLVQEKRRKPSKSLSKTPSIQSRVFEENDHPTEVNEVPERQDDVFDVESPQTAFDYAMKLRREEKLKDGNVSHNSKDSFNFGLNFNRMTRDEIYTIVKSSVIYNENDIVALNKPFGMSCQGGSPNDLTFISKHLDRLARDMGAKDVLLPIHRLDKDCTGVLVYAKTELMANLLRACFSQRKVVKIYWAILKGTPDPNEGIIDIPIAEGRLGDRRRMVLRPEAISSGGSKARTYYKVISTRGSACLVELRPETGLKHQLRVHTAFGLSCGILGDHKYSHRDKFAPQKLSGDILSALKIRSQDARDVPLHLHAKALVFPELLSNKTKNLFIRAEVPKGFRKTLRKLRLSSGAN